MGIEPHKTTTDEAIEILVDLYGTEHVDVKNSTDISWNTNNTDWQNRGTVTTANGIVEIVLVWFREGNVVVNDLIDRIGSPDSVGVNISGPGVTCIGASLFYPYIGLEAILESEDKSVGVSNTQSISGFMILLPWPPEETPATDTVQIPWDGYREYCPPEARP